MPLSLDGINEKLKRAKESIRNLEQEIATFLSDGRYGPSISDSDPEIAKTAISDHLSRNIPERFSVLAGEIIYGLRSSLDHLACQLFMANGGKTCDKTEFPIYSSDPRKTPSESKTYTRKIERFSPRTQALIENLQPYRAGEYAANEPLAVLHDLNNIDKHRELVVVGATTYQSQTFKFTERRFDGKLEDTVYYRTEEFAKAEADSRSPKPVKVDGQHIFQVAFAQVGSAKDQPIILVLNFLFEQTERIILLLQTAYT